MVSLFVVAQYFAGILWVIRIWRCGVLFSDSWTYTIDVLCLAWFGVYMRVVGALWWILNADCWCLRFIVGLLGAHHSYA